MAKIMKKILVILAIIATVLLALTGCSNRVRAQTANQNTNDSQQAVENTIQNESNANSVTVPRCH